MKGKKFTKDELRSIRHALDHLASNRIDMESLFCGWYSGDKKKFVARHVKAKALLKKILEGER